MILTSQPLFFIDNTQTWNNENALLDCSVHYLLVLRWTFLNHIPLSCAPPRQKLQSQRHPGLNLWNISPVFVARGATARRRDHSKSYFSSGNCKWSACLKSSFICHPMKRSQIQSVNYGAINYYLQTSMKYVHSLQNKSTPAWSGVQRTLVSIFYATGGEFRQIVAVRKSLTAALKSKCLV